MALSETAKIRLNGVKIAILSNPERYDQNLFVETEEHTVCNTACCIAGWAVLLDDPAKFEDLYQHSLRYWNLDESSRMCDFPDWESAAAKALDVSESLVSASKDGSLFCEASMWPAEFADDYYMVDSPENRAHVAAARIDAFLKADGEEEPLVYDYYGDDDDDDDDEDEL